MLRASWIETPIGNLAAAFSPAGLVRIAFSVDSTESTSGILSRWYPDSKIAEDTESGEDLDRQLREYFAGARRGFHLELDVRGTPFQKRVWNALLQIPYGSTVTYGALADQLSGCARAVGSACGANPISIIIPCHRVISADGGLRGYGGGLAAKRYLLELEGALAGDQKPLF